MDLLRIQRRVGRQERQMKTIDLRVAEIYRESEEIIKRALGPDDRGRATATADEAPLPPLRNG